MIGSGRWSTRAKPVQSLTGRLCFSCIPSAIFWSDVYTAYPNDGPVYVLCTHVSEYLSARYGYGRIHWPLLASAGPLTLGILSRCNLEQINYMPSRDQGFHDLPSLPQLSVLLILDEHIHLRGRYLRLSTGYEHILWLVSSLMTQSLQT